MTLRHTLSLILSTIAIYEPDCADPGCFDCKVRRKWEAALAEVELAEAVIEAARLDLDSHWALAALDAGQREQD